MCQKVTLLHKPIRGGRGQKSQKMGDIIWMAPYSTTILHSIAYIKYSNIFLKTLFMFMWALTTAVHRMKNLFRFSYSQNLASFEVFLSEHFIKHTYLKSLFLKSVMQYYIVTSFVLYIELVNCVLHTTTYISNTDWVVLKLHLKNPVHIFIFSFIKVLHLLSKLLEKCILLRLF